eukprot:scaffold495303_cov34-Prasinocladus_malaysianus.AAC.1
MIGLSLASQEGNTCLQRQLAAEVLESLVEPIMTDGNVSAGATVSLLRSAATDLAGGMLSQSPGIARRVLQYHAELQIVRGRDALMDEE